MKKRKMISVEELFAPQFNKKEPVSVSDTLDFLYKRPKSQIVLLDKSFNVLSDPNIEIVSQYININTFYTQIDVEILNISNGFKTDLHIPYINGIESIINFQPDFQLSDILIYLKDVIEWDLLDHKLSNQILESLENSIENQFSEEILLMQRDLYSTSEELQEEFLNEIVRDEYYGFDHYNELFYTEQDTQTIL